MIEKVTEDLVSAEVKARLKKEANDKVKRARVKAAEEALAIRYEIEARQAHLPEEELVDIRLNLAGNMPRITLDGVHYEHDTRDPYRVTRVTYNTLVEIEARGWLHDATVGGAFRQDYKRPKHEMVNRAGAVTNGFMRL